MQFPLILISVLISQCFGDGSIDINIRFVVSTDKNPSFLCSSDVSSCTPRAFPLEISVKTNIIAKSSRFIDVDGVVISGPVKGRYLTKFERKFSLTNIPSPIRFIQVGLDLSPRCNEKCGRPAYKANGSFPIRLVNYKHPAEVIMPFNFGASTHLTVNATVAYNYRCLDERTGQNCHCKHRQDHCSSREFLCKSKVSTLCCPSFLKEEGFMCVRESSTVGTATTTISSLSTTESQISSFSNDFMTTKSATEATSKPNIQLSSTDHLASTGHLAKTTIRPNEYESPSPSVTAGIASGDNKLATNADKSFVDSSDSRISAHNTTLSTAKHINNEQFTTEGTSDFRNLNGNPFSNDSDKLLNQLPTDLDVDKSALNQMNLDITNLPNPANNLSLIASIVSSVVSTLVGLGGIGAIGTVCYQRVYKASRKSPEFTVEIACANDSDNAEKTEKNTDAEEIVGNSEPPKADEHLLKASNVSQNKLNPFLNSSDSEDFDKSSSLKQRMNDFFSSNDSHRPDKRHKNFDTKTEAEKAALIDTTDPSQNFEIVDETIHRPDQQKMIDKSDHFHLPKLQVIEQSDNPPRPPKRLKKSILSRIDIDSGLFELGNLPIVNPDINELCNDVTWEMARPIPSVRPTLQMTTATVHTEAEMSKSKKLKPQRVSWHDATVEQRKSTGPILPPKLPEKSPNEKPVNGKDKTIVEIPEYFEAPKKDLPTTHIPHKPLQNEPTAKAPIEQNYHIPAQLLAYSPEKDNLKELPRNSVLNSQPTSSIISDFDPLREFNNDYMPKSIADNSDSHEYQNMLISQADEHLYDSVHSDLSRRSTPNSDVQPSAKIIARNLPKKPSHLRRGNYIKKSGDEASQLRNSFSYKNAQANTDLTNVKPSVKSKQQEKVWYSPAINNILMKNTSRPDKIFTLSVREPDL